MLFVFYLLILTHLENRCQIKQFDFYLGTFLMTCLEVEFSQGNSQRCSREIFCGTTATREILCETTATRQVTVKPLIHSAEFHIDILSICAMEALHDNQSLFFINKINKSELFAGDS